MSNFFETSSQKERRIEQEKQGKIRKFSRTLEQVEEKQAQLGKECSQLWEKAKQQLASGQKSAAASTVKLFKMKQLELERYSRFQTVVRNRYSAMQNAADMQNTAAALAELAGSCGIDIDQFEDDMENTAAAMDDLRDMEKIMESAWGRENRRLEREFENSSLEDEPLLKSLANSIALPGTAPAEKAAAAPQKITEENVDSALEDLLRMQ